MSKIDNILKEITTKGSIYDEVLDNILYPNLDKKNELISEIAVSMLSNEDKVAKVVEDGWFKYWFISTVRNQVKSSTSPFHKNVRQTISSKFGTDDFNMGMYTEVEDDDLEIKELIEERQALINQTRKEIKCTWFESEVFRLYYDNGMTYRAIEAEYGIDHCLAFHSVKKVRQRLQKAINNKLKNKK